MRRSISRVFADLAAAGPDRVVVSDAAGDLTASELDRAANGLAWRLLDDGLARSDLVTIALPNDRSFVVACVAVWKAGGTPHPVSLSRTPDQRAAISRVARPAASLGPGDAAPPRADAPPDAWAASWKAPTSSGSTGDPKVVLAAAPALVDPTTPVAAFLPMDAVQLVSGPLSHSAVFTYAMRGLMTGHRLVILPRFDAAEWIAAVERHRVTWALVVPTMMHRMLRLDAARERVASLETVLHMGAPCAPDLKRAFLDWLGPERVVEVYAGSESNGLTMIRGDEWLAHPGSVGRPIGGTEIAVRREDGGAADVGEVGQVWMRRGLAPTYRYLGASSSRDGDGWDTLRDRGRVDGEGYLYLEDRVDDLILRGGGKIAPAPIEGIIEQHPAVRGAVVCGIPDDEFGAVVAAVVELSDASVDEAALRGWVAERLPPGHRPVRWLIVREPVRDDAGKTSRRSWAARFAEVDTPSR